MRKKLKDARIIDEHRAYFADRGFDANFRDIVIPNYDDQMFRPVLMPAHRDLPLNSTLRIVRKNYDVGVYLGDDLDQKIIHNARSRTIGSYVILVRTGFEPDEEYLGRTTKEADPYGMIGMNLRERLILGDKVYAKTKKHLDVVYWTLCTGSRYSDGFVPCMCWSDDEVRVSWGSPGGSGPQGGLREAVS